MALDTFIAGRFSGTFNSNDVGITRDGFELQQDSAAEVMNQTDKYGDSIIDAVYRGGSCYLTFNSKAVKTGSMAAFWPWGSFGVMATAAAPIGRLASDVASAFVLTSTANTPAAATPASLTASKAILAPNSNLRLLYTSKVREVPVRLLLLPSDAAGTVTWFTLT